MARPPAGLLIVLLLLAACRAAAPTASPMTALEQRLAQGPGQPRPPTPSPRAVPTLEPAPTVEPFGLRRATPTRPGPRQARPAEVVRVESAGAIVLRVEGRVEPVDLIGVVPVERVPVSRPLGCFAQEATAFVRRALPVGSSVDVEPDPGLDRRDGAGRLRLYVWLADGTSLNLEMLRQGLGGVAAADREARLILAMRQAERDARRDGMGVWSTLSCYDNPDTRRVPA